MSQKKIFTEKITLQAVVILLLASCFYLYEFIIQVSPGAIAQKLMQDFAIDATKYGFIYACFYYSYTPLQLTTGLLLDRYSARIILTLVSAICAFGVLLFAVAPNVYIAAIARLIIGAASSCAFIGVLHLAIRWVPPVYFAFFAGIVEMMGSLGGAIGSKPFAILLGYFDWRTITIWFAYAGFILAILIACLIRNQPAGLATVASPQPKKDFIRNNLKTVLHSRETWLIGIYSFAIWAQIMGFAGPWGAQFLHLSCHLDNVAATQAIVYIWAGIAIASPLIGWLSDIIERRCIIMTMCAIAGAIAMIFIIFLTNINAIILNILMFTLGFASAGQTLSFALIKDNHSPHTNSTANGFNNMCIVAGGLLFPLLIGKILDMSGSGVSENNVYIYSLHAYQVALTTLPVCYLIAALVSIFGIKETYCRTTWLKSY